MPTLNPAYVLSILLVFVRIGGLFAAAPVLSQRGVPAPVKALLGALLAVVMVGLAPGGPPPHAGEPLGFIVAALAEAATGMVIGFSAQFVFSAVQAAGEVMGYQVGLSMAQLFDPLNGEPSNPLGRFLTIAFTLAFLLADGHHMLLRALAASFEVVPLGGAHFDALSPLFIRQMGGLFYTALRLAAPLIVIVMLMDFSLGVIARMMPQLDLFSLGLPVKLLMGLSLLYLIIQNLFQLAPGMVDGMTHDLLRVVEALAP